MAKGGEVQSVRAAGCVVWRVNPDAEPGEREAGLEILVIHRERYDDWSFPKGKLDEGETDLDAAVREVREETNVEGTLGPELSPVAYTDHKGRSKTVRYWPLEYRSGEFEPNEEVDSIEWLGVTAARARLSYQHDAELLMELVRRWELS